MFDKRFCVCECMHICTHVHTQRDISNMLQTKIFPAHSDFAVYLRKLQKSSRRQQKRRKNNGFMQTKMKLIVGSFSSHQEYYMVCKKSTVSLRNGVSSWHCSSLWQNSQWLAWNQNYIHYVFLMTKYTNSKINFQSSNSSPFDYHYLLCLIVVKS